MHSHDYVSPFEPVEIRGKNVVVVGMGNSAMDIASELSAPWMAARLYVSARRGVWVLPKYRNGQPADKVMAPPDIPKEQALAASRELIRNLVGNMSDYGLPSPTTSHSPRTRRCRRTS
jgi:cation diffusion facilitator CzcD-associated flavoprotein CzcO